LSRKIFLIFLFFSDKIVLYPDGGEMKLFSEMLQAVLREKNLSDRWLSREIEKLCGKGITSATIGKYSISHSRDKLLQWRYL